jgi:hypothetical protein
MAAVTVLRRATGKAHPTSVLEADTILVGGVELSAAGVGNVFADAFVTDINIGTGATATIDIGSTTGGAVTLNSGGTIAVGDGTAGAVSVDSGAGVSLDAAAASNFTTSAGALTLTSADAATWSTGAGILTLDGAGGLALAGNAGEIDLTTSGALDLNAGAYTLDCSTATVTPTSTYDLEATGAIGIDSSAAINIGDTNATAVQVGRAGVTVTIPGDLVVSGTTTSVDNENMQTQDNHIYLNKDYTTVSGQTGGLALNYLPTATTDTEAAGGFTAATTVATTGASGLATGGGAFVQVSGAANPANDGIYEVATHAANVLTINSSPTHRFCNTAFTVDATGSTATFTIVNISVIQSDVTGDWQLGKADDATALTSSLSTIGAGAGNSLQAAYVVGNTISMSDANGDFDVSVGSGTPAISLDAAGASNFTVASANLSLGTTTSGDVLISTTTAGEIDLTSAGLIDINAAANLDIDVTGTYDMLATGAFSIDGTGASNVSADSGDLTVSTTTSGSLILDGVALVDINAGANLDVDVTGTVDILATGAFSIDGTGASNVTTATGDLTLAATAGSAIVSGGEAAADAVQITAGNAAGGVDVNAGTGGITADTTAGISLDADTASNFTVTTGALTLETVTSGDLTLQTTTAGDILLSGAAEIDLTAVGLVDINGASLEADLTGAFSIDGATASNITVSGATADLTLGARSATITLNESGDTALDGGFTATSIIGALNELLTGGATENRLEETYVTTNRTVGEAVIIDGDSSADTQADASALSTTEGFIGIVLTAAAGGVVVTSGTATALFENGTATPAAGDPIYLSEVAGRVTGVAPTGNPNSGVVVWQIGILKDDTGLTPTTIGTDESAAMHIQPMQPMVL